MSVGAVEITDLNRGVADVDNSGDINSVDARLIARYAVELDQLPFPNQTSVWSSDPEDYLINLQSGDRSGLDFNAILIGDVSGNWMPAIQQQKLAAKPASHSEVSVDNAVDINIKALSDNVFEAEISLKNEMIGALSSSSKPPQGSFYFLRELTAAVDIIRFYTTLKIIFGAFTYPAQTTDSVARIQFSIESETDAINDVLLVLDEDETRQVLNIRPALVDNDSDGLTDAEEVELGSDPYSADTDGDGLPDLTELNAGTNPAR